MTTDVVPRMFVAATIGAAIGILSLGLVNRFMPKEPTEKPVVVIVGPSGAGKTTMADMLQKALPGVFSRCITHTTREPREGEINGVHYHFVKQAAMTCAIADGEFVEVARVYGNLYGTSRAAIQAARMNGAPLLILDTQGADTLRKSNIRALYYFISPPSLAELKARLTKRGSDLPSAIEVRMHTAKREIADSAAPKWTLVLVNDDIDRCYDEMYKNLCKNGVFVKK